MRNLAKWSPAVSLLLVLLCPPGESHAQLAAANAAALGTGNNYTALARGTLAISLNPAGLAQEGTPGFSLAVFPLEGQSTLAPVTLADLADYSGKLLPVTVREEWLQTIASDGGQTGSFAADITPLAFNVGRIGFQASTLIRGSATLNQDAAELLLFGNAGRTGAPGSFDLGGSNMQGFAVSTFGISAGHAFDDVYLTKDLLEETLSVGATLKLSLGHALALAQDAGTFLDDDPLQLAVNFPMIQSDSTDIRANHGWGVGFDLGAAWSGGPWYVGLVVKDVVNTFEWKVQDMFYRSGEAFFDGDTASTSWDPISAREAPTALLDAVSELTFKPSIAVGGAYAASESLRITADVRKRFGEGIDVGPELHLGLGFDFQPISVLALRAGGAFITDGYQGGGGIGVDLGLVRIGAAAVYQGGDAGDRTIGTISLTFVND